MGGPGQGRPCHWEQHESCSKVMQEHVSVVSSITETATVNPGRQLVPFSQLTSQLSKTWMPGIPRNSFHCFLSRFLQVPNLGTLLVFKLPLSNSAWSGPGHTAHIWVLNHKEPTPPGLTLHARHLVKLPLMGGGKGHRPLANTHSACPTAYPF